MQLHSLNFNKIKNPSSGSFITASRSDHSNHVHAPHPASVGISWFPVEELGSDVSGVRP